MPTSIETGKLIFGLFRNASMLAKLAILIGIVLVYAVLILYRDVGSLNEKISDCHEMRVKEITSIYQKQIELEYKVKANSEQIEETDKRVKDIKSDKVSLR